MMAQRVDPLASGPARMVVLAGRSRSCLQDRSTHSGNLRTSKENEGKAIKSNPGASSTHKLEKQACQRVSLSSLGNWLLVGHRSSMETWHKIRSCSLPGTLFSTGLGLQSHPLTCSPAFALTPPQKARGTSLTATRIQRSPHGPGTALPLSHTHLRKRRRGRWG